MNKFNSYKIVQKGRNPAVTAFSTKQTFVFRKELPEVNASEGTTQTSEDESILGKRLTDCFPSKLIYHAKKTKIYAHAPSTRTGTNQSDSPWFSAWNTNPAQIWESFYVQAQVTTDFITLGLAAFYLKRISHLIVYNLHILLKALIFLMEWVTSVMMVSLKHELPNVSTTTESHWDSIFHAEWLK